MHTIVTQADALLARARRLIHDYKTQACKDGATLEYTLFDVRRLLAEHPQCENCRLPVGFDMSLDHRKPISRGGRHARDNLAVCCRRCNSIKGQMTEGEFRELLALLSGLHLTARADLERRLLSGGRRYGGR